MKPPRILVVHHTALTNPEQLVMVNESHRRQGYPRSELGYNVGYNFFIGTNGKIVQTRGIHEGTWHTRNRTVKNESISIVFAGNFEINKPTPQQLESYAELYRILNKNYKLEHVEGHTHASPTKCPGKYLTEALKFNPEPVIVFDLSRYYSPVKGQLKYYRDTYEQDAKVNCNTYHILRIEQEDGTVKEVRVKKGDTLWNKYPNKIITKYGCMNMANGWDVRKVTPLTTAACPPTYPMGTKLWIDGYGEILCTDRGGAIKGNRIDIWTGIGEQGLINIARTYGGLRNGKILK